jgi:hypothetical protein
MAAPPAAMTHFDYGEALRRVPYWTDAALLLGGRAARTVILTKTTRRVARKKSPGG